MKQIIIGTAGHVDHGKTSLIKALTGMETDRLKEEKQRGITIELGFAWMDFKQQRVGIIDVPGHEKFVRHMLAGVGGMDVVMLVIAADEGVMPQTVEHLDILSLLGIEKGMVVITKTDLAEKERLKKTREQIQELTKGTFLEKAPVMEVSVYKKQGIEELKEALEILCCGQKDSCCEKRLRLPVDRIFSVKGFGTVATGTLTEGSIRQEDELMLYPSMKKVKVRGIQVYSREVDRAFRGQRTAVNLAGCKKEEIHRGDVLAAYGSMQPSMMADVRLTILKHSPWSIKNGSRIHFYQGTKECLGKVILMEQDELKAGETGYAQIRLEDTTVMKKGDRFVIRFYSPAITVGGGMILDGCPQKHSRKRREVLRAFSVKESGSKAQQLELAVLELWGQYPDVKSAGEKAGLSEDAAVRELEYLLEQKKLIRLTKQNLLHPQELDSCQKRAVEILEEFHRENPLKEGMGEEEFKSRMRLPVKNGVFFGIKNILLERQVIKESGHIISLYSFQVMLKGDISLILEKIKGDYSRAGFALPTTGVYIKEQDLPPFGERKLKEVMHALINRKILIRLCPQYCIHSQWYHRAKEEFARMSQENSFVVLGAFRDRLQCSRKVAVAILEYFDKEGYTMKLEEGRILR